MKVLLALTFSFLHRFVPLFLPFLLLLLHAVHFLLLFLTTLAANALMAEEDKKAADGHSANTAKYSLKHTRRRTLFFTEPTSEHSEVSVSTVCVCVCVFK